MTFSRFYYLILFLCFISCASHKRAKEFHKMEFPDIIQRETEAGFGGFYLNIEKTMKKLGVSRLEAHEIQNQMRDSLESVSGSFSIFHQAPYLQDSLAMAIHNVTVLKNHESGFTPRKLRQGEFYVVLDLDETVLTQWYHNAIGEPSQIKGHLGITARDKAIRAVDKKTLKNLDKITILNGPAIVTFRPKVKSFLKGLEKVRGYQGFVIFTAKEDLAAWDIVHKWKEKQPKLFKQFKGMFTRNYLTYGGDFRKPSKDLRIVDKDLKHVFLVDDNESRVIQKDLNYKIPKFNADYYWDHYMSNANKDEKWVFDSVLDYVLVHIKKCQGREVTQCLSRKIAKNDQNFEPYLKWLKAKLPRLSIDKQKIKMTHLFHQDWVCKDFVRTDDEYPNFLNNSYKF